MLKSPTLAVDLKDIKEEGRQLVLPLWLSFKYDGFRILTPDGNVVTRSMKPLPNVHASQMLSHPGLVNMDMEIMATEPTAPGAFNLAQSVFKRRNGEPQVFAFIFDDLSLDLRKSPYSDRYAVLQEKAKYLPEWAIIVNQLPVTTMEEVDNTYEQALALGYEGIMGRRADSIYEERRATVNNQFLVKMKPFRDEEVTLERIEEGQTNNNPAFVAENGKTKRSTSAEGMVPSGMAGTLVCRRDNGNLCNVSPGKLTHKERIDMLQNPDKYIGRRLTERSMDYGQLESTGAARQGRFFRWRDAFDQ
jgi:DNA ligase-1